MQAKPSRAEPSRAKPSQAKPSLLTTAYLFFICQENFMKNLLGKFHAELSQQRLASQAEPSQTEPSRAKPSQAKPSQAKPSLLITAYHVLPRLTTAYHGTMT